MLRRPDSIAVVVAPVFANGTGVIRAMGRKGAHVVAVDSNPRAVGFRSRFAKEKIVLPSPLESPGELTRLLLARPDLHGAIVIPTDDFYVRELHANYDTLAPHYKLAVSPGKSTRIALDKSLTYDAARAAGLSTPKTLQLDDSTDLDEAAQHVGFPAILRPAFSIAFAKEFGKKNFPLENPDQLKATYEKASRSGHDVMLQEVIPGPSKALTVIKAYVADSGDMMGMFSCSKLSIHPPMFGTAQALVTVSAPEAERSTAKLLDAISFRGSLVMVEWKYDSRDATYKLIEINARCVLSNPHMSFAGADLFEMLWRDKLGLPRLEPGRVKLGRKWAYLKTGLLLYKRYPEERLRLRDYLKIYSPPICFSLLDFGDLKPFLYDVAPLVRRQFRR